jgi:hypothetical protein
MHLNRRTIDDRFKHNLDRCLVLPAVALHLASNCESNGAVIHVVFHGTGFTTPKAGLPPTVR